MKGLVRIAPEERTDLYDVHVDLAKIIEQMPEDFVPLTIEGSNEHPKAIDFTNIIGTGFLNFNKITKNSLLYNSAALESLIKIIRRKIQKN